MSSEYPQDDGGMPRGDRAGGSALLVEDDPLERTLLRTALEGAGFTVTEAASGREGLRCFAASTPDLVLLDIIMPGIDGFETCRQIRALPAGARVPVIITTALDDEQSIAAAYAAGATDFVSKPVNCSVLVHRARYILRAHQVLANLDALTGLPGRRVFSDWIASRDVARTRAGSITAVFYLALDRFRIINDTLGRAVGDELLLQVAERLRASLRARDMVRDLVTNVPSVAAADGRGTLLARAGGDEFVVWLEGLACADNADAVAGRLLDVIREPFRIGGEVLHVTASVGIALGESPADHPPVLVERAEAAMDQAKRLGRDSSCLYDTGMNECARRAFSLERVIRAALEKQCFEMHLQPKVDLQSGGLRGMEALMRLDYPGYGTVSPADFIPVAEQTGLILALDRWALHESCRQARRCIDAGLDGLVLAVNLSASLFNQPDLARHIADVLDETGLEPGQLEVELTERVLLEDTRMSLSTLSALRELGVGVSVDDFGTGYSSLSYLKRFKTTGLKIDRAFIKDVTVDPDDATIVDAIVGLGLKLGMVVTGEGVETQAQAEFLRACGCQEAQGFLYSKALPVAEFIDWVKAWQPPARRYRAAPARGVSPLPRPGLRPSRAMRPAGPAAGG